MKDELVYVKFVYPVEFIKDDGSNLRIGEDGQFVGIEIPRSIADEYGLAWHEIRDILSERAKENSESIPMSRKDWFMLGITHALLVSHVDMNHVVEEAKKLVGELLKE